MTSEPFSLERFQALADAYGGVIARWPDDEKDDALRVSRTPEGENYPRRRTEPRRGTRRLAGTGPQ
ncbi:hypothetical protein NHF48_002875 [Sphingomonas sp. H160509]|uniref:hypothetical protein n=1 Tax=Sphingomonas sp. H160509 TaxID=2955313 RepID=UPI0020976073|nr:hypothetical protein [Sphingomonas sp. H160509]MDD1450145.1 hypothetical protein [Sphingomonas sp. H160509]